MEELRSKLWGILETSPGNWGFVMLNIQDGSRLEFNPDRCFPAASMIKVPIMAELMRQAAAGVFSLDEAITVTPEACVGGAGILKDLRPNIPMTVRDLITLMIILSDNTATNLLIDLAGMDRVNQHMADLGLKETVLRRYMMDFAAAQAGCENSSTPADLALLFSLIASGSTFPAPYKDLMLDILQRQQIRDKLPFYWPEDTILAHKTGTLPGAEHDGGILYLPGGPYIVVVMSSQLEANYFGLQQIAHIGRVIYQHFYPSVS